MDQHALTLRMWVIGVTFSIIGCGLNTLFTLRNPSVSIAKSTAQLLAYPAGRLWDAVVPTKTFKIRGMIFCLNPHPFNQKEHTLIFVMANVSFYTRMTVDLLVEQKQFFGLDTTWAFGMLIVFALFLIGFGIAGLTRSSLVTPREVVWPGLFSTTALTADLHKRGISSAQERTGSWTMSGFAFFCIVFVGSFCWYWVPDFVFPALSKFSFLCWIWPDSAPVNQVFGISSGMGLLPLTFDWSQVAYVSSPLLVPPWAIVNVAVALVFWIYIISPILYYSNVWNTAYFPLQSSSIYDNTGQEYNVTRILSHGSDIKLEAAKYEDYSPIFMPVTYALNTFALAMATAVSVIVWIVLEKRKTLAKALAAIPGYWRRDKNAVHPHRKAAAADVPAWWYIIVLALGVCLAVFCIEYWRCQLRWYGVLLSLLVSAVFYYPTTLIYATGNIKIGIEILWRIIGGLVWEGQALANLWFVGLGYTSILNGESFSQDMKLCQYYHISPGAVFLAQCVGIIVGTVGQVAVTNWSLGHIKGICTSAAINGFSCPFSRTNFNTSIIWGAIGLRRFFSADSGYRSLFYLLIPATILPVIVHNLKRRYPHSIWKDVSVPLLLGGLSYMPPATGMNYGSWAIVGLVFGVFIRRRHKSWWQRYNFVLGTALDSSVSLAGMVIFFAVYYTGASERFQWWGTKLYQNTCDYAGCPHRSLPPGEKIGL